MDNDKKKPIIRGLCVVCKNEVTTHQLRIKLDDNNYFHQDCYKSININNNIPILDKICSNCHKPISKKEATKISSNGRYYHENISSCKLKKNMILL